MLQLQHGIRRCNSLIMCAQIRMNRRAVRRYNRSRPRFPAVSLLDFPFASVPIQRLHQLTDTDRCAYSSKIVSDLRTHRRGTYSQSLSEEYIRYRPCWPEITLSNRMANLCNVALSVHDTWMAGGSDADTTCMSRRL